MPESKAIWWARENNCSGIYYELELPNSSLDVNVCFLDSVWYWGIRDHEDMLGSGSATNLADAKRACVEALKNYYNEMLESLKEVDDEG